MSFSFNITHVFPGSEKQKAAGIYATFNLNIDSDEGTVISVKDLKLNKSAKDGKYYIGSPYREYDGKDDNGNPEKKKVHFIKLWPEQKNWPKQDQIVNLVIQELKNGSGQKTSAPPAAAAPKAATKPVVKAPSAVDEW